MSIACLVLAEPRESFAMLCITTTLSTELAIATQKNNVTLPSQYTDYADVFSEQMFNTLPP